MKQFENLTVAAEKAGCTELIREAEERIRNLEDRRQTGVFIIGGANSGKTTILNGIVGSQLREPGFLTEEEKPLKVVFEKQDDEEAFECRLAVNRFWNDEDAILYEVKNTDIFSENMEPDRLLDAADVVFYVVSAVMPFSSEDMEIVKALSFLRLKIVLNKMDLLDEESQKRIEEYVTGICTTLGVGEPIVIRTPDWESIAKEFRAALPSCEERELLRSKHEEIIHREVICGLLGKAEERLTDIQLQYGENRKEQLEAQEKQALWGKLRTRMLEQGEELSADVSSAVRGMAPELSEKLGKLDAGECERKKYLQEQTEKEMESLAKQQSRYVEERMKEDAQRMMESAVNLGLAEGFDFNDAAFSELTSVKICGMKSWENPEKWMALGTPVICSNDTEIKYKRSQILAGTAVAIGLFVVLPLPTAVSWAGGVAAAGIGGSAYVHNAKEVREREWQNMTVEYCETNLRCLADVLADAIKGYYGRLANAIKDRANTLTVSEMDEEALLKTEKELSEIAERCRSMLKMQQMYS